MLDFVYFLKTKIIKERLDTAIASESSSKDWLLPEEDKAWQLVKGDVVVVPFPFSDLSQAKRRPALVVSKIRRR